MEVVYSADGHETMHVGVRLPFEGESLEAVLTAFAPIPHWEQAKLNVVVPVVGASGTVDTTPPPPPVIESSGTEEL